MILMHDGGGNRSHTVAARPTMLRNLKARGYGFTTMSCT
jgi:peptidoglycan/xylan/chitin deacetylase (PgdA/CDA1 family)